MHCRSANQKDIPVIVEFQQLMAQETEELHLDPETVLRGVTGVFDEPGRGRYFVAEDDGRVVGCLLITYEWSDWRNRIVWWIQSVYVSADVRQKGVYASLYEHVKALVQQDDSIGGIRLYVDRRNTRAQAVYTRAGMNGEHYLVFEWMK